jgi:glycosyltransferase involved in cell wall biosynthesis
MRILYDAYWWGTGPISGRVVMKEILTAWRRIFPQDDFVLAVRRKDLGEVRAAFPELPTVCIWGKPHGVATLSQYAVHARRHKIDVAYTQNFAPPGVWTATFIHDVMYQTNPEWFTLPERAYFWLIPRFARRAGVVLTSSQHEAERIRRCNPKVRRVEGIGLAVATRLTQAEPVQPPAVQGLDGFVLTVGRLNIRKNLGLTLTAALASGRLSRARPLVVVGGEDGKAASLPAEVRTAREDRVILFVPEVSDAELAWLYRHADLFVYFSLDEGFGLPPVEAMQFGAPVLVSDIEVFHENLGDLATYVNPHDVAAMATAIASSTAERVSQPAPLSTWEDCVRRARAAIERARG